LYKSKSLSHGRFYSVKQFWKDGNYNVKMFLRQQTLKDIKSSLGLWPGEVKMQ